MATTPTYAVPYVLPADTVTSYPVTSLDLANRIETLLAQTTPVGAVTPYAGAAAPAGWLLCQGQAVSRTTYAALFAVCGTTYGVGNGSSTFNLPDLTGRAAFGVDGALPPFAARGTAGGNAAHHARVNLGTTATPNAWIERTPPVPSWTATHQNGFAAGAVGSTTAHTVGTRVSDGTAYALPPYITLNYIIKI